MQSMNRRALTGLAVAAAMLPGSVLAADSKNQGYLVDAITGNVVTSSTTGLCVRTSDWTPARAVAQCDPDLVKKAPPPKAAPAPAPTPYPAPAPKALPQSGGIGAPALFALGAGALLVGGGLVARRIVRY